MEKRNVWQAAWSVDSTPVIEVLAARMSRYVDKLRKMFAFGRYTQERRLLQELRKHKPDPSRLDALREVVTVQMRTLPLGLLWQAMEQAEKARRRITADIDQDSCLRDIHRIALYEIQSRNRTMRP